MATIVLEKQQVPDTDGADAAEKALQAAEEAAQSASDANVAAKNAELAVDRLSNEIADNIGKIDEAYTKADNAEQLANGLDEKIEKEKEDRITSSEQLRGLIEVEEEARKAGDKDNSDAINELKENTLSNAQAIEQNTQSIALANQSIDSLTESTNTALSSISEKLSTDVQLDTTVTGNDSTVTISKVVGAIGGDTTETEMALPVASEDHAGVINPATYKQIQDASEKIDVILVSSVYVEGLPDNPTDAQLTAAWKQATGKDEVINGAKVTDESGRTYTYYANANIWKESSAGGGAIEINQFTNTSAGIIKGSTEDGKVFAESDGSGSVNGWDDMIARANSHDSEIEKLKQDMETEDTRTKNLPTQVMYKTSLSEYAADKVTNNFVVKDLHTGGDATIPVEITGATSTRAGVMTAQHVSDLTNVEAYATQIAGDVEDLSTKVDSVDGRVDTLETMVNSIDEDKQDTLVSGTNIKTVNGNSLLGEGNIEVKDQRIGDTAVTKINNLPTMQVSDVDIYSRTADHIRLGVTKIDLGNGVTDVYDVDLTKVTDTKAGLMVPAQKQALESATAGVEDAKTMASAASASATAAASSASMVSDRVDEVEEEIASIKQNYMKTSDYHVMTAAEFKAAWDAA